MIRKLVLNREPTKPEIGQVHLHLTAQCPLRADREYVADDQHPDHENRINRRTAGVRVIRIEFLVHPTQIEHGVDLPDQMIGGHDLVELKGVEKLALSLLSAPHHGPLPSMTESIQRNHGSPIASIGVLQQNRPAAGIAANRSVPVMASTLTEATSAV